MKFLKSLISFFPRSSSPLCLHPLRIWRNRRRRGAPGSWVPRWRWCSLTTASRASSSNAVDCRRRCRSPRRCTRTSLRRSRAAAATPQAVRRRSWASGTSCPAPAWSPARSHSPRATSPRDPPQWRHRCPRQNASRRCRRWGKVAATRVAYLRSWKGTESKKWWKIETETDSIQNSARKNDLINSCQLSSDFASKCRAGRHHEAMFLEVQACLWCLRRRKALAIHWLSCGMQRAQNHLWPGFGLSGSPTMKCVTLFRLMQPWPHSDDTRTSTSALGELFISHRFVRFSEQILKSWSSSWRRVSTSHEVELWKERWKPISLQAWMNIAKIWTQTAMRSLTVTMKYTQSLKIYEIWDTNEVDTTVFMKCNWSCHKNLKHSGKGLPVS